MPLAITAAVELPVLFTDGMVLQRDVPVPVWGWGKPGAQVTVSLGTQSHTAEVGKNGKWTLRLPPLDASTTGRNLTIKVGNDATTIRDVVIGEVWLCSGQSNMSWQINGIAGDKHPPRSPEAKTIQALVKKDVAQAGDSLLRIVTVTNATSRTALEKFPRQTPEWISSHPDTNYDFSAVAYYFGRRLRKELDVPVGLIQSDWGATKIQPWMPTEAFEKNDTLKKYYSHYMAEADAAAKVASKAQSKALFKEAKSTKGIDKATRLKMLYRAKLLGDPYGSAFMPAKIYNAKIHPLVPYGIKGALWYQGESNREHPENYAVFLKGLIEGWRNAWGQGDFSFYFAQLANFETPLSDPVESHPWTTIQYQQSLALTVPRTGMAVLNDIGEARDIHPKNKVDVGERFALLALARDYGRKGLIDSGPTLKSSQFSGDKVSIVFESVGEGLMVAKKRLLDPAKATNTPLGGFQICGADRTWRWADAKITGKDRVEVSHPAIKNPIEVRYAWAPNPKNANLYNMSGLPTSLFKTTK